MIPEFEMVVNTVQMGTQPKAAVVKRPVTDTRPVPVLGWQPPDDLQNRPGRSNSTSAVKFRFWSHFIMVNYSKFRGNVPWDTGLRVPGQPGSDLV